MGLVVADPVTTAEVVDHKITLLPPFYSDNHSCLHTDLGIKSQLCCGTETVQKYNKAAKAKSN